MKDQFATYQIAQKLNELNYNEPCLAYFERGDNLYACLVPDKQIGIPGFGTCYNSLTKEVNRIGAPLWQQVREWFNKQYKLDIQWLFDWVEASDRGRQWTCVTVGFDGMFYADTLIFGNDGETPLEVLELGVLAAIQLVKEHQNFK